MLLAPSSVNNNNSTKIMTDSALQRNKCESSMLSRTHTTKSFTRPEVPIADDVLRFPLGRKQERRSYDCSTLQVMQNQQFSKIARFFENEKFPLHQHPRLSLRRFPFVREAEIMTESIGSLNKPKNSVKVPRFPLPVKQWVSGQRFPGLCQLQKRNLNDSIKWAHEWEHTPPMGSTMSRSNVAPWAAKQFPTFKKQFFNFPININNRQQPQQQQQTCKILASANAEHGNCESIETRRTQWMPTDMVPTPATITAIPKTTVTHMSQEMSTKIDMDSPRTVATENDDVFHSHVDMSLNAFDVHKVTSTSTSTVAVASGAAAPTFDNELIAHEQTLNLNVEDEGVGERKEFKHQQAENFNDAFGRRHDNENDNNIIKNNNNNNNIKNNIKQNDYEGVDAMNAISAKNKCEKCEQSKLETMSTTTTTTTMPTKRSVKASTTCARAADSHNELNMTKERQSICLASEQSQRQTTIAESAYELPAAASNRQQHQLQLRHSEARESSSKQVDGQEQRQQINASVSLCLCHLLPDAIDTQAEFGLQQSSPQSTSSCLPNYQTSAELLKCAVRELLHEASVDIDTDRVSFIRLELIDILSDLVELIETPTTITGSYFSEPIDRHTESECVDMTVSKVSDDSEATVTVVDIFSDHTEQPFELDDNNSVGNNCSSSNQILDMKYEDSRSISRVSEALPRRLSSTIAGATSTTDPIASIGSVIPSRNRDVDVPMAPRLKLGELQRSSSSRDNDSIDVESVLPERTRLRRQRRMRSQDSAEEKPEDVIERINKLKARISGALSEVKGVLKQYSTESEAEATSDKSLVTATPSTLSMKNDAEPIQPVHFRFVKKNRRRSYFDESEEDREKNISSIQDPIQRDRLHSAHHIDDKNKIIKIQENSENENLKQIIKNHDNHQNTYTNQTDQSPDLKLDKNQSTTSEVKSDHMQTIETQISKATETNVEQNKDSTESLIVNVQETNEEQNKDSGESDRTTLNKELQPKSSETSKQQSKLEFLAKVQSELKSKSKTKVHKDRNDAEVPRQPADAVPVEVLPLKAIVTTTQKVEQPVEAVEALSQAATLPKESATQPKSLDLSKTNAEISSTPVVTKKKPALKLRDPRRASIAAVEQVRIVPETEQISALAQRRPSDSEAIVKRKKKQKLTSSVASAATTTTTMTSGSKQNMVTAKPQSQEPTKATSEPNVTAKVNSNANTANCETIPTAKKSVAKTEAATTAPAKTSATTTAATATPIEATSAASAAPNQLPIEEIANRFTTATPSRRASLKLAELVGETVLVTTAATQDKPTIVAAAAAAASQEILSTAISSSLIPTKEPINQSEITLQSSTGECVTKTGKGVERSSEQVVASTDIEVAPVDIADSKTTTTTTTPQIAATLSEVSPDESSPQKRHQQEYQEKQTDQDQHQHQHQHQQQQQQQHLHQQLAEATKGQAQEQINDSLVTMPELKVLAGPVQPVKIETVEQPHDEGDLAVVKKKAPHLKKLIRKSSIDKGKEKVEKSDKTEKATESNKLSNIIKDNKVSNLTNRINKITPPKKQTKATKEQEPKQEQPTIVTADQQDKTELSPDTEEKPESEPEEQQPEAPAPPPVQKKPRQIKKKVIIKCQKRKLSIGDTFFIQQEPEEPKVPEIETIEKAIAYVTDDEDDDVEPETEQEPAKPLKSCLHIREYKIGDLILYAERYRKTQVRWKRGRVLDRITSISYKLEIEGKEVPAHISYIKKYTGRKVKFVGKEYLDIDYEQVVEEERRSRSYSIWNMV